MNALVKKEIRLVLPAWIAAMLAVTVLPIALKMLSLMYEPYDDFFPVEFGAGILFLGLASFGQEFSFGTFTLLLSQPVPRQRIWLVKILVFAVAAVSALAAAYISYELYLYCESRAFFGIVLQGVSLTPPFPLVSVALCVLVILSGSLWTTLWLRQVTGAFWFTLLTPLALSLLAQELLPHRELSDKTAFTLMMLYSLVGFFWAHRMFLRAQDTWWTGGEVWFWPRKQTLSRTAASLANQPRHWISALLRKELQLHQVSLLIALVLLVLHLTSAVIRKVHGSFDNPMMQGLFDLTWGLWVFMPLLIGSAAVAEERKLGTMESQLCLPVSRRMQFFVKFFVGLILSLLLGAVMPYSIERGHDLDYVIFVYAGVTFFIAFYASTLAHTMLQAIGIAFCAAGVIWAIVAVPFSLLDIKNTPGEAMLFAYGDLPALALILTWLALWNFKRLHENWKVWWLNFVTVSLSIATLCILTQATYFRAWEFLTPDEPMHGTPVRLSGPTELDLALNRTIICATLGDGRLWAETLAFDDRTNRWFGNVRIPAPSLSRPQFIGDSNWVAVATDDGPRALGIQSNGSLWRIQPNPGNEASGFKVAQIGSETNWREATGGRMGFLLLKTDGSLWIWGTNIYIGTNYDAQDRYRGQTKSDSAELPGLISEETNWTAVFVNSPSGSLSRVKSVAAARKDDGSVWQLFLGGTKTKVIARLEPGENRNPNWISYQSRGDVSIGVNTHGELWYSWDVHPVMSAPYRKTVQIGKDAKWKTAAFVPSYYGNIVAMRSDGTLWSVPMFYMAEDFPIMKQVGHNSDWITLYADGWPVLALAADGSIWDWGEPSRFEWLAPSRKPMLIGNIFQGTKAKAE